MKSQVAGIQGVLETYLSSDPDSESTVAAPPKSSEGSSAKQMASTKIVGSQRKARLGRPPGPRTDSSTPKEKATLRISADLMAEYRDWSWEARCQLGELVERALADYRQRHRPVSHRADA